MLSFFNNHNNNNKKCKKDVMCVLFILYYFLQVYFIDRLSLYIWMKGGVIFRFVLCVSPFLLQNLGRVIPCDCGIFLVTIKPLYTSRHFHCYMLDEFICHFRGVGSI